MDTTMLIILTLFGLMVFIFSLFTVGFKAAFKRLLMFSVTGLVLDVLIGTFLFIVVLCQ